MKELSLVLSLGSLFVASLIPLSLKALKGNKEPSTYLSAGFIIFGILLSGLILFFALPTVVQGQSFFHATLWLNPLRLKVSLALLLVVSITVLMSLSNPQVDKQTFSAMLFLKMGAVLGLLTLLWSGNLLIAFVGLELASLAFYLLIALGRTGKSALKASFKYFILGSAGSAFLLLGISFMSGATGHFDLSLVMQQTPLLLSQSRLLALALVFILAGFLFKVSVFPFQFWLPDVYHGAFTSLLVFMAVGFKLVVFVLLFEWTKDLISFAHVMALFQWLAVLSLFFGTIIALRQKDLKKVLLFSTIAHSGYLFMLLIASQMGYEGQGALFYYLIIYSLMTLGVFLCVSLLEKPDKAGLELNSLKGLAEKEPLIAFFISFFLLSLAGLPPMGGFLGKLFVFQALVDQGLWWTLFWAILGAGIALYYYLKPIALMYMEGAPKEQKAKLTDQQKLVSSHNNRPWFLNVLLYLLMGGVLLMGLLPSFFSV